MSPILSIIVALLGLKVDRYFYLQQMFYYVSPIVAIPTAWFLDRFGLRVFVYVCIGLTAIRNGSRALLFYPDAPYWLELRFVYWFVSGVTTMQIVVGYYSLPLKVAENWFPKEERSLAWTCIALAPQLGVALGGVTLPHLVTDVEHTYPLTYLNLAGTIITALVLLSGVSRSLPKHPPSNRRIKAATADSQGIKRNILHLMRNRNLIIQVLVTCPINCVGDFFTSILQDILGAAGLSHVFTGNFLASMTLMAATSQLAGSLALGRKAARSTREEASSRGCKIVLTLQCIALLGYTLSLSQQNWLKTHWWVTVIAGVLSTVLKSFGSPIFANMSAQLMAGSVTEATMGAVSSISYCITMSIYSTTFVYLRREDADGRANYSRSMMFASGLVAVSAVVYLVFFHVKKPVETDDRERQRHEAASIQGS